MRIGKIQLIVDEEYMAAFGMSHKDRRALRKLTPSPITKDWSTFDPPAIDRLK